MTGRPELKIDAFEGPLDLLLFLIGKNKVSILDIPILPICEQYHAYLQNLREDNIEVASEFLQMAARLIYIKTVMLLPKSDEGEQLRAELAAELMEYQVCRMAAEKLRELAAFDRFVRLPAEVEPDRLYTRRHDPLLLASAFFTAVGREKRNAAPQQSDFDALVARPIVSVTWGVFSLVRRLRQKKKIRFFEAFQGCEKRDQVLAVFEGMLGLIKAGRIEVAEDGAITLIDRKRPAGSAEA